MSALRICANKFPDLAKANLIRVYTIIELLEFGNINLIRLEDDIL